jgi:hypothetical protein
LASKSARINSSLSAKRRKKLIGNTLVGDFLFFLPGTVLVLLLRLYGVIALSSKSMSKAVTLLLALVAAVVVTVVINLLVTGKPVIKHVKKWK